LLFQSLKIAQSLPQTQKTIQAQGQNGDNYPTLKVLESNQNYYLQTTVPALQGADVKIKTTKSIGLGDGGEHIKHTATKAKYLDKDGIDAHANSTKVYDYLKKTLNMNSYDNQGGDLLTITNYLFPRSNSSCEDCYQSENASLIAPGSREYFKLEKLPVIACPHSCAATFTTEDRLWL
jgi:Zn-dependent metalloprotease